MFLFYDKKLHGRNIAGVMTNTVTVFDYAYMADNHFYGWRIDGTYRRPCL